MAPSGVADVCRAICPCTEWPHLFCFPSSSGYFFIINLSGASLLRKWLRLLDAITESEQLLVFTSLSHCCEALGLQVSPPGENPGMHARVLCRGPLCLFSWSKLCSGFLRLVQDSSLWYKGPADLQGATWICCCCGHGTDSFSVDVIRQDLSQK